MRRLTVVAYDERSSDDRRYLKFCLLGSIALQRERVVWLAVRRVRAAACPAQVGNP
jgi:hypothetical protein